MATLALGTQVWQIERIYWSRLPDESFVAQVVCDTDCPVQPAYRITGDITSGTFITDAFTLIQVQRALHSKGYRIVPFTVEEEGVQTWTH